MNEKEPKLSLEETKEAVSKLTHPRVTEEGMKEKIREVSYHIDGQTTICLINMKNGFRVIGHSTPASPENFDELIGQRYAYENAFKQLWQFEGYLLRERIHQGW